MLALAPLALFVLLFLIPGAIYWIRWNADIAHCLWGDATCTGSIAQYLLVITGDITFAAAIWAGWSAFKAYEVGERVYKAAIQTLGIEQSTTLGQRRCEPEHEHQSDLTLRVDADFSIANVAPDSPIEYDREDYQFISLGRSPLVNVTVFLRCTFDERDGVVPTPIRHEVEVGSMRSDSEIFCRLWIHKTLLDRITIEWTKEGANCEGALDFRPLKRHRPKLLAKRQRTAAGGQVDEQPGVPYDVPKPPAEAQFEGGLQ